MRFNRLIYLFSLLLWLLATKSTKYIGIKKQRTKTGDFNRGECLGSPHTGHVPVNNIRVRFYFLVSTRVDLHQFSKLHGICQEFFQLE